MAAAASPACRGERPNANAGLGLPFEPADADIAMPPGAACGEDAAPNAGAPKPDPKLGAAAVEADAEVVVADGAPDPNPNPNGAVLDSSAGADDIEDTPAAFDPVPAMWLLVVAAEAGEAVETPALNSDPKLDAAGGGVVVAAGDWPDVRPEPKLGLDEGEAAVLALKPDAKIVLLGAAAGVAEEAGLAGDAEGGLSLPKTLPAFVCGLPAVDWEVPVLLPCPKCVAPRAPNPAGNASGAAGEG